MTLALHNLKPAAGSRKNKKRIGRGNASGHGTYSCRGIKGQKSRSGGKGGLKLKGFRPDLLKIAKTKGFRSIRPRLQIVSLSDLEKKFSEGETVNPKSLAAAGLVRDTGPGVKILGNGRLNKKLSFKDCLFSESAQKAVTKAGGKIESK